MDSFSFDPPSRGAIASSRDAGLPAHGYAPGRGKLTQITHDNTGKVCNQTIVSPMSPSFFKSPYESNRDFFQSSGRIQKLKAKKGEVPLAAGRNDELDRFGRRHDIICEATGRVHNQSVVSRSSPEWFKNAFNSNKDHFYDMGVVQQMKTAEETQKYQLQAALHGVPSLPKEKPSKKMGMVHPVTGRCYNRSIVSVGVPEWMKGPYEANRDYFDGIGMTQHLVNPPNEKDGCIPLGTRSHYVNPETGKLFDAQIVSQKSPSWMKQSFENNRAYFENKGLVQKLREPDLENLRYRPERRTKEVWELRKSATSRANKVSEEAPEWMISPVSARASQYNSAASEASTVTKLGSPGGVRSMIAKLESRKPHNEKKLQKAVVNNSASSKKHR